MTRAKICGVTSQEDLAVVARAGADAVGLNLIPASKRYVSTEQAAALVAHAPRTLETVAVVADLSLDALETVLQTTGVAWVQLHGAETPEYVAEALRRYAGAVYKAVRIAQASDVETARGFPGDRLLVDAKVEGELGGTGHAFDWTLVTGLARERTVILAGGLTPHNVEQAVAVAQPWAVDVASGVELPGSPRSKSAVLVEEFVRRAHGAAAP